STDSEEIASIAKKCGIEAPFIRPSALATDSSFSIDVVLHAIHYLEKEKRYYDAVCLLQPTNPFRPVGFIDKAIQQFEKSKTDSLISVLPVPEEFNPHWVFEPGADGTLHLVTGENEIVKRRQDLPPAFFRDGSIYITKTSVIKQQHSFYGDQIGYIESDPFFYVNIDNPEDFVNAENKLPAVLPFIACAE
ncbi:MAG TPA: acylneuraminate cytidylyltransferase family protein, partial [Chitinophagaceae bacterium]|nr:acylneuraminate cytidylyltransferase family protein [Chitinophagaceae bacterium]